MKVIGSALYHNLSCENVKYKTHQLCLVSGARITISIDCITTILCSSRIGYQPASPLSLSLEIQDVKMKIKISDSSGCYYRQGTTQRRNISHSWCNRQEDGQQHLHWILTSTSASASNIRWDEKMKKCWIVYCVSLSPDKRIYF